MVSSRTLYRLSGLALLSGALLNVIESVLSTLLFSGQNAQQYLSPSWPVLSLVHFLSLVLVVGGLPGICARQASQAGKLGLAGFLLLFGAGLLFLGLGSIDLLILPGLAAAAPKLLALPESPMMTAYFLAAVLFGVVGYVLLGLATMRAGVFPRWAGLFLIVQAVIGGPAEFVPLPESISRIVGLISALLLALALGWMGTTLLTGGEVKLAQPLVTPRATGS